MIFRCGQQAVQVMIPEGRETHEVGPVSAAYCLERISRLQCREGKPNQSLEVVVR